jgi:hypothetical protein
MALGSFQEALEIGGTMQTKTLFTGNPSGIWMQELYREVWTQFQAMMSLGLLRFLGEVMYELGWSCDQTTLVNSEHRRA